MASSFLLSIWNTTLDLAPSLLLGLSVAGLLHVLVKRRSIFRHIGKPGLASTFKAAVFGVPLPLCSCGVLPAALALRKDGASKGATVSFLASTPQTGVDSIAATWGMLGWPVAAAKVIAALVAGVVSGTVVDRGVTVEPLTEPGPEPGSQNRGNPLIRAWTYAFHGILGDIWGWLVLGIIISAFIFTVASPGQLAGMPGLDGFPGLLAALFTGLPLYVCSVASVPVAAAMLYAGFPPGAALVFLMAGPATNAATMGAVRRVLGKRAFLSYLVTIVVVSLGAGLLLNSLQIPVAGSSVSCDREGVPLWKTGLAGLFWGGVVFHAFSGLKRRLRRAPGHPRKGSVVFRVGGMSCGKCVDQVGNALKGLAGVRSVRVCLVSGTAVVDPEPGFRREDALAALGKRGYQASLTKGSGECSE